MQGDIVLVGLRDFQDEKGDIILKYNSDEARDLKNYGELPDNTKINETDIRGFTQFREFQIRIRSFSDLLSLLERMGQFSLSNIPHSLLIHPIWKNKDPAKNEQNYLISQRALRSRRWRRFRGWNRVRRRR